MTVTRSAVITHQFGLGSGQIFFYTVPSGFTAVVKTILIQNPLNAASYAILGQTPAGFHNHFELIRLQPLPQFENHTLTTWFVMEAGDQLDSFTDVGGLNVIVYGALLAT